MKIDFVGDGENWFECYGPDAVPLERMVIRIDQRPDEHCRQAFLAFGNTNPIGRQILDIAASWVLKFPDATTNSIWRDMSRASRTPSGVSDAANELLLLAIEWLVRNRHKFPL